MGTRQGSADPLEGERALLQAARQGDDSALESLYRTHRSAAMRKAGRLCAPDLAEDVVADAFMRVFAQLRAGAGPQTSFRAYLFTAIRNAHTDLVRREARFVWRADLFDSDFATWAMEDLDAASSLRADSQVLVDVIATLPERLQLALWWTVVEKRSLSDVGDRLGITANAAGVLCLRAREKLRDAYLTAFMARAEDPACQQWQAKLPTYARGRLSETHAVHVDAHVARCRWCAGIVKNLQALLARSSSADG